jgi:hypothetical protein
MSSDEQPRAGQGEAPPAISSREALSQRNKIMEERGVLTGARVYLSGPMDFVASREDEKRNGWRTRVGEFLRKRFQTIVYDPWNKPTVMGMPEYGKEDEFSNNERNKWTFRNDDEGAKLRAQLCDHFWPTLHIDLRMVDTTDFTIAYCPTNVYSVGTVHEIVMARLQYKPVLFVSPPVVFPALDDLRKHFDKKKDEEAAKLLNDLIQQASLKPNEKGIPSMWYMALLDGEYFFDGFGFAKYAKEFGWSTDTRLDQRERDFKPARPLLPYLETLNKEIPKRYDYGQDREVENADWLILNPADV